MVFKKQPPAQFLDDFRPTWSAFFEVELAGGGGRLCADRRPAPNANFKIVFSLQREISASIDLFLSFHIEDSKPAARFQTQNKGRLLTTKTFLHFQPVEIFVC